MSHSLSKRKALGILGCVLSLTLIAFAQPPQQPPQQRTSGEYTNEGVAAQRAGNHEEALRLYAEALKLTPKSFPALFNSGMSYFILQKYAEAIAPFEAASAVWPGNPQVHLALGRALAMAGQSLKATDSFKEAVRLDPKMFEAHAALAAHYSYLGRDEDALRTVSQALELGDQNPYLLADLGMIQIQSGALQPAIETLSRSISLRPNFAPAHSYLGIAYERLGQMSEAARAFTESNRLDPLNATGHYNLGVTLQKLGRHAEAVAPLKRATELKTDYAGAHHILAEAYTDLGDHEKALVAASEAARLRPNDFFTLTLFAIVLRNSRKYEEAIEPLRRVVQLRPDDAESLYLLGNTYLMAQKNDEAIATLSKVLEMKPDHLHARDRLRAASNRKQLLPALDQARRLVADNPNNAEGHADLGSLYSSREMFAEAEAAILKAIELEPKNSLFYNLLAINYGGWGKLDKAIENYRKAIELKPHHVLYLSLAKTYETQGNLEEAVRAYQESLKIKPTFTAALYNLAVIYSKQDRSQEAIQLLLRLVEQEPRNVFGQHALGLLYVQIGDKTAAMQQYHILQNIDPKLASDLLTAIPK